MKKYLVLGLVATYFCLGIQVADANEITVIDYDKIVTSTEITDETEITTIEVPNEYVAQWKQENNWEDSPSGEINQLVETNLRSRGASSPATWSKWNVRTKGRYNFSGSFSKSAALYINYYMTGSNYYSFELRNTGGNTVNYELRGAWSVYRSGRLNRGITVFSGISTNQNFYLKFYPSSGSSSVSGYVK